MNATLTRPAGGEAHLDTIAAALSDGTRRGLLRLVRTEERSAGALADAFPHISRPAVSQHLRVLRGAGLVSVRPAGNRRLYRARAEGLDEVWRFIDEMWTDRLGRLKAAAERAEQERPPERDHPSERDPR